MGLPAEMFEGRHRADGHAAAGRFHSTQRAAHLDRLAGHGGWDRVAEVHRKRVHDPGHRLAVGVDVGRGVVAVGAYEVRYLVRVSLGYVLELARKQLSEIEDVSHSVAE